MDGDGVDGDGVDGDGVNEDGVNDGGASDAGGDDDVGGGRVIPNSTWIVDYAGDGQYCVRRVEQDEHEEVLDWLVACVGAADAELLMSLHVDRRSFNEVVGGLADDQPFRQHQADGGLSELTCVRSHCGHETR